jgi:hypothetical protein
MDRDRDIFDEICAGDFPRVKEVVKSWISEEDMC